jgi:hypothetical protein
MGDKNWDDDNGDDRWGHWGDDNGDDDCWGRWGDDNGDD